MARSKSKDVGHADKAAPLMQVIALLKPEAAAGSAVSREFDGSPKPRDIVEMPFVTSSFLLLLVRPGARFVASLLRS